MKRRQRWGANCLSAQQFTRCHRMARRLQAPSRRPLSRADALRGYRPPSPTRRPYRRWARDSIGAIVLTGGVLEPHAGGFCPSSKTQKNLPGSGSSTCTDCLRRWPTCDHPSNSESHRPSCQRHSSIRAPPFGDTHAWGPRTDRVGRPDESSLQSCDILLGFSSWPGSFFVEAKCCRLCGLDKK